MSDIRTALLGGCYQEAMTALHRQLCDGDGQLSEEDIATIQAKIKKLSDAALPAEPVDTTAER